MGFARIAMTAALGFVGSGAYYISQNALFEREEKEKASVIRLTWQENQGRRPQPSQWSTPARTRRDTILRQSEDLSGDNGSKYAGGSVESSLDLAQQVGVPLQPNKCEKPEPANGKCCTEEQPENKCQMNSTKPKTKCEAPKKSPSTCPSEEDSKSQCGPRKQTGSKCSNCPITTAPPQGERETVKESEFKYFKNGGKCGEPKITESKCSESDSEPKKCGAAANAESKQCGVKANSEPNDKCGAPLPETKCPMKAPEQSNKCGATKPPESKCSRCNDAKLANAEGKQCGAKANSEPNAKCGAPLPETKCQMKASEQSNKCGATKPPESKCSPCNDAKLDKCDGKPAESASRCTKCGAETNPENQCGAETNPEKQCGAETNPEKQCGANKQEPPDKCGKKVCQIKESHQTRKRCRPRSNSVGKTQKDDEMTQTDPQTCKPAPETPAEIGKKCAQSKMNLVLNVKYNG